MPSNYPTSLDDFINPAAGSTLANPPHHTQHGDLNDAVEAIEAELGLSPSGSSATVRARVDAIETAVFGGATFPAQPAYGNNRPYFRTDWGMSFFYDGTRWLSVTQYTVPVEMPAPFSTITYLRGVTPIVGTNFMFTNMLLSFQIATTHTATDYYDITLYDEGTGVIFTAATSWTIVPAAATWGFYNGAVNVLSGATAGDAAVAIRFAPNGAPGAASVRGSLLGRIVAT